MKIRGLVPVLTQQLLVEVSEKDLHEKSQMSGDFKSPLRLMEINERVWVCVCVFIELG